VSLKGDKHTLEGLVRKLSASDGDGKDIQSALAHLLEALSSDIQSDNVQQLADKLICVNEERLAAGDDSDINQSVSLIRREIRVVEAIIKAQEDAAKALGDAT
jgi:hypothetical protein